MSLTLPGGTIRTKRPNSAQAFGFSWSQVARWGSIIDAACAVHPVDPRLIAAMMCVESDAQHYHTGGTTGRRADVIAVTDRFGGGPSVGVMQVKTELWDHLLPSADTWEPRGNIWLGVILMETFIREVGSWQNAIRQKYHPGTSGAGTTPQHYVDTVQSLMDEMGEEPLPDLPYRVALIPVGNRNRPRTAINSGGPRWITVHETGNTRPGTNAENHRAFTHGGGGTDSVSFHLVVDDHEAIQLLPFNEIGHHASDGCDNRTTDLGCFDSIAIETCVNSDGNWEQTLRNLVLLIAKLIRENPSLSADRIAQHNTWAFDRKNCPQRIRESGRWPELLTAVKTALGGTTPAPSPTPVPGLPAWLTEAHVKAAFADFTPTGIVSKALVRYIAKSGTLPVFREKRAIDADSSLFVFDRVTIIHEGTKALYEGEAV